MDECSECYTSSWVELSSTFKKPCVQGIQLEVRSTGHTKFLHLGVTDTDPVV